MAHSQTSRRSSNSRDEILKSAIQKLNDVSTLLLSIIMKEEETPVAPQITEYLQYTPQHVLQQLPQYSQQVLQQQLPQYSQQVLQQIPQYLSQPPQEVSLKLPQQVSQPTQEVSLKLPQQVSQPTKEVSLRLPQQVSQPTQEVSQPPQEVSLRLPDYDKPIHIRAIKPPYLREEKTTETVVEQTIDEPKRKRGRPAKNNEQTRSVRQK